MNFCGPPSSPWSYVNAQKLLIFYAPGKKYHRVVMQSLMVIGDAHCAGAQKPRMK